MVLRFDDNTPQNPDLWSKCQAEAKRKFQVHPSAYSNSFAAKRYKELGGTWRTDDLRAWHAENWKAINSSGKVVGECGSGETKGKVKCLPEKKAESLSEEERAKLAKRKQRKDPNASRGGAPIMVSSKLDSLMSHPITDEQLQNACDLLNSNNDRMDAGQMKCKVGKPCNGRCIPQNHQCVGQHPDHDPESDPKGSSTAYHNKTQQMLGLRNGIAIGAATGAIALGAGALAVSKAMRNKEAVENEFAATRNSVENLKTQSKQASQNLSGQNKELGDRVKAAGTQMSGNMATALQAKKKAIQQESADKQAREEELVRLRKTHAQNEGGAKYMSKGELIKHNKMGARINQIEREKNSDKMKKAIG